MARALNRHYAETNMNRRLKEDRNQHYNDLTCLCWTNKKVMARFKEQPKICSCHICGNPRKYNKGKERSTIQERKLLK